MHPHHGDPGGAGHRRRRRHGHGVGRPSVARPGLERLFVGALQHATKVLLATRPTAVNLAWALDEMERVWRQDLSPAEVAEAMEARALEMYEDDLASCRAIGRYGAELIEGDRPVILTHCNAGALATAGYGTALGVIRAVFARNPQVRVLVDETRPFLQGSRLTAWELLHEGISAELITDSMAGHFFRRGEITHVVVGADRIAANGDTANKIGTYTVAVLAREHGVPFYVAAPVSTLDLSIPDGDHIPIEERDAGRGHSSRWAPRRPLGGEGAKSRLRRHAGPFHHGHHHRPGGGAAAVRRESGAPRPVPPSRPERRQRAKATPPVEGVTHEGDDHGGRPRNPAETAHRTSSPNRWSP